MPLRMRLRIGKRWIYGEPTTFERVKEGFTEFFEHTGKAVCQVVDQVEDAYDQTVERLAALRSPTPEPESIGSGWEIVDASKIPPTNLVDEVVDDDWLLV